MPCSEAAHACAPFSPAAPHQEGAGRTKAAEPKPPRRTQVVMRRALFEYVSEPGA